MHEVSAQFLPDHCNISVYIIDQDGLCQNH
jgi:hypothetical protein